MNDDDFLDRLLNSSGDDLDRLIQNDMANKKRKYPHDEIEVDMSDIESILHGKTLPNDTPQKDSSNAIEVSSSESVTDNFTDHSEECFKQIYNQLTTEMYCIDRISALQKRTQYKNRMNVTIIVIKAILISIGICVCLGGAIWVSKLLLKLFPV